MCKRLHGEHGVALPSLAFVKALRCREVASREVRRLNECPGKIAIAALAVRLALFLPIAEPLTVDASAVRGKLTDAGEAGDVSHLQSDGHGENRPDAGDGLEHPKLRRQSEALEQYLLQTLDLHRECIDGCTACLDAQREVCIRQVWPWLLAQTFDRISL